MATTTTRLTIEDYERLPDELAKNHELVDGELVEVASNNYEHNWLRDRAGRILWNFVDRQHLGEVITEQEYDFDGNAHGPDISFFSADKKKLIDRRKRVQRFVPDLAIEIVSPSNTFSELVRKKERYLRCGTREVWIISQDSEEIYVYSDRSNRILSGNDKIETDLIPGFSMTVAELLQGDSV